MSTSNLGEETAQYFSYLPQVTLPGTTQTPDWLFVAASLVEYFIVVVSQMDRTLWERQFFEEAKEFYSKILFEVRIVFKEFRSCEGGSERTANSHSV
jgi:hypothetical protein